MGTIFGIIFGPETTGGTLIFGSVFGGAGELVSTATKVDHVAAAIGRLPEQFKKTKIIQLLTSLVTPCQSLEDALWQLIEERAVGTAVGVQLDQLGGVVGQDRGGLGDDDFRRYIRARIMTNRSRGAVEDLIRIANLILSDDGASIEVDSLRGTAVVRVRLIKTSDQLAGILLSFLAGGAASSIRVIVESSPDLEEETFTLARAEVIAGGTLVGATEIPVYYNGDDPNLDLWPRSGQIIVDQGTASEETIGYTLESSGSPFYLTAPATKAHADSALVVLVDGPGRGLGSSLDAGQPTLAGYLNIGVTGGRLADARD